MAPFRPALDLLKARYKRLTARRGPLRALVAVEHSIITVIWHMLTISPPHRRVSQAP